MKNSGDKEGTKTLELSFDGETKTKKVTLGSNQSKTVSFNMIKETKGIYDVNISGMSGSFEVVEEAKPPAFSVSDLIVEPAEVKKGEEVNVSVIVKNTGGKKGTYTAELLLNGKSYRERDVKLSPNQDKTVDFSITVDKMGTYEVKIGDLTGTFKVRSEIMVEYEVTTKLNSAYLRVTISGAKKGYDIILSGPDKQTVGEGYISRDDMADGTEATDVSMTELLAERKNPKSGQYTLTVKQFIGEKIFFEATPEFEGAEISIIDAQFETSYDFSGNIDEIMVTAQNSGDLPVFVDEIKAIIDGEEEEITLFDEPLPHGENTQIETTTFLTNFEKGVHPVTIELYSSGEKLASYDTQVEIG